MSGAWDGVSLAPCPFCGEKAEIERVGDARASTIYACTVCGCRLETGEEWGHGRAWNTRVAPPATLTAGQDEIERMLALVDELCASVDAASEDVGGHRGSLTILRELGLAANTARTALATLAGRT